MNGSLIPDELLVKIAYEALCAFGCDLDRTRAAALLDLWRYRADLSPSARDAVLARFAEPAD